MQPDIVECPSCHPVQNHWVGCNTGLDYLTMNVSMNDTRDIVKSLPIHDVVIDFRDGVVNIWAQLFKV